MDYNKMIYGFYINQLWIILMYMSFGSCLNQFWIIPTFVISHII